MLPGHRICAAVLLAETTENLLITGTRWLCSYVNRESMCRRLSTIRAILALPSSVLSSVTSPDPLASLSSYLDPMKGGDR